MDRLHTQELDNPISYIENNFMVISKAGEGAISKLVPMKLWPIQRYYIENRTNRNIILKPRQVGLSTCELAANGHIIFTVPYQNMIVVTHDQETSEFLLQTFNRFYRNLRKEIRPVTDWKSGSRMRFPVLDSYIYIDSAKSDNIGVGHGLNRAHLCLHPDTKIQLLNGYLKAISDVISGDITFSKKSGQPVEIKHTVMRPYTGKLCKITFYGNPSTPLICTPEHQVVGQTHGSHKGGDGEGWIEAQNCKWIGTPIREIKASIKSIPFYKYTAGNERKHIKAGDIKLDYDFGWLIGLFYAEGSFKGGGLTYSLSPKETDYENRIIRFCDKFGWGTDTRIFDTHGFIGERLVEGSTMNVIIYSTSLENVFDNIMGKEKVIPDWFWKCHESFLNGVIDGYVAGDGHCIKKDKRHNITSVRPYILYQIRDLILSVRHQYSGIGYSDARKAWWLIYPMQPCFDSQFYKDGSYQYIKFQKVYKQPYVFVKVKKREFIDYEGFVYDLETKGSYRTPSGIIHNSELPKWPPKRADQLWADITQTVPIKGIITAEATPQGRGGLFYDLYFDAKKGTNGFTPFFFPWWWEEEYIAEPERYMTPQKAEQVANILNQPLPNFLRDEQALANQNNLSPQQLAFRRMKIGEIKIMFFQEYAENDIDCWLTSDISVVDPSIIRTYNTMTRPGRTEGNVTIWEDVIGGRKYIIGVDVAAGYARGDFSVASVLESRTLKYVARLRGRIPPDLFAEELYRLGMKYNTALIGVERIGHGHSVIRTLLEKDYSNIYYHVDYDEMLKQVQNEPGWKTSLKTKPVMVTDLLASMRATDLVSYSENLLVEAAGLTWEGQQKVKPSPGGFDDEWDAVSIALQLREQMPIIEDRRPVAVQYAKVL